MKEENWILGAKTVFNLSQTQPGLLPGQHHTEHAWGSSREHVDKKTEQAKQLLEAYFAPVKPYVTELLHQGYLISTGLVTGKVTEEVKQTRVIETFSLEQLNAVATRLNIELPSDYRNTEIPKKIRYIEPVVQSNIRSEAADGDAENTVWDAPRVQLNLKHPKAAAVVKLALHPSWYQDVTLGVTEVTRLSRVAKDLYSSKINFSEQALSTATKCVVVKAQLLTARHKAQDALTVVYSPAECRRVLLQAFIKSVAKLETLKYPHTTSYDQQYVDGGSKDWLGWR